jgi:hypothetical protein
LGGVRWFTTLCFVFLWMPMSWAQHQEPSLVDRLLRPNMELQNNAQGKKFSANSAVIERRGTAGTFLLQPTRREKSFADTRVLAAPEYPSRSFHEEAAAAASLQNRNVNAPANISTASVRGVHDAYDAHSAIASRRTFTDQRPFQEQGKSQKSLDRQNPPLTIEQVRELLNKNK